MFILWSFKSLIKINNCRNWSVNVSILMSPKRSIKPRCVSGTVNKQLSAKKAKMTKSTDPKDFSCCIIDSYLE